MSNEEKKSWFEVYFLGVLLLIVFPITMIFCFVFFVIPWHGEKRTYSFSDDKQFIVKEHVSHLLFYDNTNITFYDEFYSVDGEWYIRSNAGCGVGYKKIEIEEKMEEVK